MSLYQTSPLIAERERQQAFSSVVWPGGEQVHVVLHGEMHTLTLQRDAGRWTLPLTPTSGLPSLLLAILKSFGLAPSFQKAFRATGELLAWYASDESRKTFAGVYAYQLVEHMLVATRAMPMTRLLGQSWMFDEVDPFSLRAGL